MSAPTISRRGFITLAGAGLTLALLPVATAAADAPQLAQPFLRIAADGSVTVLAKHLDMGQGIWTGLASIVAEELDAAWEQIRVEGAPADKALYKNLAFGAQTTGGSTSIANSWDQYRRAGAVARLMLVQAAAALWRVPTGEIGVARGRLRHVSGREAGFGELAGAAALLAVPAADSVTLKDPAKFEILGKVLPRLDVADKARGKIIYGIDVRRPGQKIAMIVRSPRFGGKVARFDAGAARKIKGVVEVVQVPNGVAVVANNTWAAREAQQALVVEWDFSDAEQRSSPQIIEQFRALALEADPVSYIKRGDSAAAFARAVKIVEADYEQPYLAHAPMEPLSAVCEMRDGACEIWGGIQSQSGDQAAAAKILGLPLQRVRLHTLYAGSSFGRRATFSSDWIAELAEVVKATGARYPVKMMWSRADDIQGGFYRPLSFHKLRAGLDAEGRIVAVSQTIVVQSFLFGAPKPGVKNKPDPTALEGSMADRYDIADASVDWVNPPAKVPVHMFRALGYNHTTFSKEVFMDELARAAGADPLAFRLRHLGKHPRQATVLALACEKAGWDTPVALGRARGLAVQESHKSFIAQVVEVSVADGVVKVERLVCAIDCGLVLNPDNVRAQVEGGAGFAFGVALLGKITLKDGQVEQSNFHDYQVLRMNQMPRAIEVHIVPSTAAPTGVGEPVVVVTGAAVANALARLSGKPVRVLPLSELSL
ncbi:molybdopterin cofactor-binding domain-containing protein [Duganella sp. BuS-21]|uniref:xanthine dehydrogenase family protein molybdopterin-binding subunit n=1 Tax=Duganella sp. BuS-21 TaxID=2943848 RepID=UPI0035A64111